MARLDELFRYCKEKQGSDLHLSAGMEPRIRRHGELEAVAGSSPLSHREVEELLVEIVHEELWREYQESGDCDFAYGLGGVARFRCNYLRQENGAAAVFRVIPQEILTLEELGVPTVLEKFAHLEQGLVLMTGPTGSGKSTTLAAIIDRINRTFKRHIVTIEDPVEFVHSTNHSFFSQREVGRHTESFGAALKAAVREDADVVLVGEMRDLETIALAITAAEMGTLVFATLHTNGAITTIDRLIDAFPAEEQSQIRASLGESLQGVASQLLFPTVDGHGRVAAVEILFRSQGLPNVIREGNTPMIRSIIQAGKSEGMRMMDESIMELVEAKKITPHDAYLKATDKKRFEALV